MKISIVVPVYNVEKYLSDCLDSLLAQTLKDIEIICVNDGSTDSSLQILKQYSKKDNRIKIISQSNKGLSGARNTGIENAKGEYIGFLDSDDWIAKDFYEKLYNNAVKKNADISAGLTVYSFPNGERKINSWVNQHLFYKNKNEIVSVNDKQYSIYSCAVWNKIYKRELIEKAYLRFIDKVYFEDYPFNFMATVLCNKIVLNKDAKLYYRQQPDSICAKSRKNHTRFDNFKNYEICEKWLNNVNISEKDREEYFKILENFKIFNLYAHMNGLDEPLRSEFRHELKNCICRININKNKYIMKNTTPYIYPNSLSAYNEIVWDKKTHSITKIYLLGNIFIFSCKHTEKCSKFYLFGLLPILTIRRK